MSKGRLQGCLGEIALPNSGEVYAFELTQENVYKYMSDFRALGNPEHFRNEEA